MSKLCGFVCERERACVCVHVRARACMCIGAYVRIPGDQQQEKELHKFRAALQHAPEIAARSRALLCVCVRACVRA